uniref:Uncharacterized protein n=1 Tax=Arundo donax TaxID=35708 RepID=A0A0A8XW31_ARUDO
MVPPKKNVVTTSMVVAKLYFDVTS